MIARGRLSVQQRDTPTFGQAKRKRVGRIEAAPVTAWQRAMTLEDHFQIGPAVRNVNAGRAPDLQFEPTDDDVTR
jgi:hypothetical protein